jgi:predicted RNA-binding protein with RPS1 domain
LIDAHQSASIRKTKSNPNPKRKKPSKNKIDPDPEKPKTKFESGKTRILIPEKLKSKSSISQLLFF